MPAGSIKRIAFFLFPQVTTLDFVAVYDALRRVATMGVDPTVTHRVIGSVAEVRDDSGLRIIPDGVYESLDNFDLLVVPGGFGTRPLMDDKVCIDWLRTWGTTRPIASVCTGSLLLGRAGYLRNKRATTHHSQFDLLRPLVREISHDRVVDEGNVITAGGVTSALDLGIHLLRRFWGPAAAESIAAQMEYRAL